MSTISAGKTIQPSRVFKGNSIFMTMTLTRLQRETQHARLNAKEIAMAARQSSEVQQAIRLHQDEGKTVYEAARAMGIWPSTLYRALKTKAKRDKQKQVDRR